MRRLMLFMLAVASAVPGWGANAPILSAVASSQVAFQYNRPDTTVCVWEVSTSATYAPLIADLTNQNDSGAQYTRWFILGQNTALSASTAYYWRQTCGAEVHTGQFTTVVAPTGSSTQFYYSSGGHPLANKLRIDYGATPALGGGSVTVDCTPRCSTAISWPADSIIFVSTTYLNDADVVASGSVQVAPNR